MACRRRGGNPLPESMLDQFLDAYMRHWGGGGEVIFKQGNITQSSNEFNTTITKGMPTDMII